MLVLQDMSDFSIHTWYEQFKHISLKSILIKIPDELLMHLQSDECHVDFKGFCHVDFKEVCSNENIEQLTNAIYSLQGNAFVKNNWHAPTDAKRFSFANLLKVRNLNDLTLYLSASARILQDFAHKSTDVPYYITLKPWKSIHPASEFRCIIINHVLRGITPRDCPTLYAHFKEDGQPIIEILTQFFEEHICRKFPRKHYTVDVVLCNSDRPYILDFGPLNGRTNLYDFSWKEISPLLNKNCPEKVPAVFRYLQSGMGFMTTSDAIFKIASAFRIE